MKVYGFDVNTLIEEATKIQLGEEKEVIALDMRLGRQNGYLLVLEGNKITAYKVPAELVNDIIDDIRYHPAVKLKIRVKGRIITAIEDKRGLPKVPDGIHLEEFDLIPSVDSAFLRKGKVSFRIYYGNTAKADSLEMIAARGIKKIKAAMILNPVNVQFVQYLILEHPPLKTGEETGELEMDIEELNQQIKKVSKEQDEIPEEVKDVLGKVQEVDGSQLDF